MTTHLEASSQLFGSYLHQDWVEEFATDVRALEAMVQSEPSESLIAASREIRDLISSGLKEAELAKIMTDRVGCYFDPKSKGQTYREWLSEVLKQLSPGSKIKQA